MALDDEEKRKLSELHELPEDEDEIDSGTDTGTDTGTETGTGTGGAAGQIEFRDFIATEKLRDDLDPSEINRLKDIHSRFHEANVKKQKSLSDERKKLKEGKISLQTYRNEKGAGSPQNSSSRYKPNPVLANAAQFSGVDRQVNAVPTEHIAETNQEKGEELQYQHQLRNQPTQAPKFNPKPQYR